MAASSWGWSLSSMKNALWHNQGDAAHTGPKLPGYANLEELCHAFQAKGLDGLQDTLNALLLSECVYKVLEGGPEAAAEVLSAFKRQFPPGLVTLQKFQNCLPHVQHRYVLARGGDTLYACFMGTKHLRDLLANADLYHEAVWQDALAAGQSPDLPSAHRGFLARARGVPAEELYKYARSQNLRLVLCGHSLGGAVAVLCTLRLLRYLPQDAAVRCIVFGTPAIGNAALADLVSSRGWQAHFSSIALQGDLVPRLLALPIEAAGPATEAPPGNPPSRPPSPSAPLGKGSPAREGLWGRQATPQLQRLANLWPSRAALAGIIPEVPLFRPGKSSSQEAPHPDTAPTTSGSSDPPVGGSGGSGANPPGSHPLEAGPAGEAAGCMEGDHSVAGTSSAGDAGMRWDPGRDRSGGAAQPPLLAPQPPTEQLPPTLPLALPPPSALSTAAAVWASVSAATSSAVAAAAARVGVATATSAVPAAGEEGQESAAAAGGVWGFDRLQTVARGANAGMRTAARRVVPEYVHFGGHHMLPHEGLRGGAGEVEDGGPGGDVEAAARGRRQALFAKHRMSAYRDRARSICARLAGPLGSAGDYEPIVLAADIAPALEITSATAVLPLLPIPAFLPAANPQNGSQLQHHPPLSRRWLWGRHVPKPGPQEPKTLPLTVLLQGAHLGPSREAQLTVLGQRYPARVLKLADATPPGPSTGGLPGTAAARDGVNSTGGGLGGGLRGGFRGRFQATRRALDGLRVAGARRAVLDTAAVEAAIPAWAARQLHKDPSVGLQATLLSDFFSKTVAASLRARRVWIVAAQPPLAAALIHGLRDSGGRGGNGADRQVGERLLLPYLRVPWMRPQNAALPAPTPAPVLASAPTSESQDLKLEPPAASPSVAAGGGLVAGRRRPSAGEVLAAVSEMLPWLGRWSLRGSASHGSGECSSFGVRYLDVTPGWSSGLGVAAQQASQLLVTSAVGVPPASLVGGTREASGGVQEAGKGVAGWVRRGLGRLAPFAPRATLEGRPDAVVVLQRGERVRPAGEDVKVRGLVRVAADAGCPVLVVVAGCERAVENEVREGLVRAYGLSVLQSSVFFLGGQTAMGPPSGGAKIEAMFQLPDVIRVQRAIHAMLQGPFTVPAPLRSKL